MVRWVAVVAVASMILSGCGSDEGGEAPTNPDGGEPQRYLLEIEADDFTFSLENEIPAGEVHLELENVGKEVHQALIYRLNDGVGFEDYREAVIEDDSNVPKLSRNIGGVQSARPGRSAEHKERSLYEPGVYAIICFIRSTDLGKGHHELGMIASFTVR